MSQKYNEQSGPEKDEKTPLEILNKTQHNSILIKPGYFK